jgi:hypothetical protein
MQRPPERKDASPGEQKELYAKGIVDSIEHRMQVFPWKLGLTGNKEVTINNSKVKLPKSAHKIWELMQQARNSEKPYSAIVKEIVELGRKTNDEANTKFFDSFLQPNKNFGLLSTDAALTPNDTLRELESIEASSRGPWTFGTPLHGQKDEKVSLAHADMFQHFRELAVYSDKNVKLIKAGWETMRSRMDDARIELESKMGNLPLYEKIIESAFVNLNDLTTPEAFDQFKKSQVPLLVKLLTDMSKNSTSTQEKTAMTDTIHQLNNAKNAQELFKCAAGLAPVLVKIKEEIAPFQKKLLQINAAQDRMEERQQLLQNSLARQMTATSRDAFFVYKENLEEMNRAFATDAIQAMTAVESNPFLIEKVKKAHQDSVKSLQNYTMYQETIRKSIDEKFQKIFKEIMTVMALYAVSPALGAILPTAAVAKMSKVFSAGDQTSNILSEDYSPEHYQKNSELLDRMLDALFKKIADNQITIGVGTAAIACAILFPPSAAVIATGATAYLAGKTIIDFANTLEAEYSDTIQEIHALNAQKADNEAFFGTTLKASHQATTTAKMFEHLEKKSVLDPKLVEQLKTLESHLTTLISDLSKQQAVGPEVEAKAPPATLDSSSPPPPSVTVTRKNTI